MNNEPSWLLNTVTWNKSSAFNNDTGATDSAAIYVFTPAPYAAKQVLAFFLVFFWRNRIYRLLSHFLLSVEKAKKKSTTGIFFCTESDHVCKKSLSVRPAFLCGILASCLFADVVGCVPKRWACKIVRYINFVFPAITINNLVVISLEKYLSTRPMPQTFRVSTVRKMIISTWLLGIHVALFPAATFDGIRVDLNETHYTVICRNVELFYPFKLTLILFPIQFVMPTLFIIYVNVSLIRTVWIKRKRQICYNMNNVFKVHLRATRIKGISP